MSKEEGIELDLLDVVGGGLEKCARSIFGQPGECGATKLEPPNDDPVSAPEISDTRSTSIANVDVVKVENRQDTENERSEAPSVLSPILSTAAIKMPEFTAPTMLEMPEMPDVKGQIERMTANVLAVGNCQRFERPGMTWLPSLRALPSH